jgi:hypothetical protein
LTRQKKSAIIAASALKENKASAAAFHERRAAVGWKPPGTRGGNSLRSRRAEQQSVGTAVPPALREMRAEKNAEIGWYRVRLSRPMANAMGVFYEEEER